MDLSTLPTAGSLLPSSPQAERWRPGLTHKDRGAQHSEVFAGGREASGAGLALALALDGLRARSLGEDPALLWVQDAASLRLTGRPYRPGLPGPLRRRLIHVAVRTPEDALFALEEGVRCRDFACVIGEIAGNPKALDFTASRRLTLAAERHGMPLYVVRLDAARDLSSARMRWEARPGPSLPSRWNAAAPGRPSWRAELFRARGHVPGTWILADHEHRLVATAATQTDHGDLAGAAGDRSLAAG